MFQLFQLVPSSKESALEDKYEQSVLNTYINM